MERKGRQKSAVDILVILAVFCVFTITALFVVLLGAKIYRNNVDNMTQTYNARTSCLYITERIRSSAGKVELIDEANTSNTIICLNNIHETATYNTYIFVKEDALYEYSSKTGEEFNPQYGQYIMDIKEMHVEYANDTLLHIIVHLSNDDYEEFYINTNKGGQL